MWEQESGHSFYKFTLCLASSQVESAEHPMEEPSAAPPARSSTSHPIHAFPICSSSGLHPAQPPVTSTAPRGPSTAGISCHRSCGSQERKPPSGGAHHGGGGLWSPGPGDDSAGAEEQGWGGRLSVPAGVVESQNHRMLWAGRDL